MEKNTKPLNSSLQIRLALKCVFQGPGLINQAYFFVVVPFASSLLLSFVLRVENWQARLFLLVFIILLNILYQFYLWSVSFFYAQQVSEGDLQDYGLSLAELTADLGVKWRLLIIRLFWYAPLLFIVLALAYPYFDYFQARSWIDPDAPALGVLGLFLVLLGGIWWVIVNNVFLSLSNFIYAETGSVIRALNLAAVMRLLFQSWADYLLILGLWIVGQLALLFLAIPLAFVALIPILGGLMLGFVLGLSTMYNTLFLANLQGQAWQKLNL